MPLDYARIQEQLIDLSEQFAERRAAEVGNASHAAVLLDSLAGQTAETREKIMAAAEANPGLRSAIPTDEDLTGVFMPPVIHKHYTLLAADGSQVNPNRHDSIPFGVINIGVFRLDSTLQVPPREIVETELLPLDAIYNEFGLVGEEVIALRRDLRERQTLSRLAGEIDGTVLTLTDGPLELFRDPQGSRETQHEFEQYLSVLRELAEMGTITAGYVDRPGSDLVVRMLEIVSRKSGGETGEENTRPLAPLTDAFLFQNRLPPGARSAIFAIQSQSASSFTGETALHFFYLNTGFTDKPSLARVEIPAWVANNTEMLGLLHAVLLEQCRHLGGQPYPYALHRSHEIALVTMLDKDQIEGMINRVLVSQGLPPAMPSNKQFAKNLSGRMRNR
ncbi:DNA double-strand break repair nuclease NurA [Leptolinea tardivitalis]|nr:DNA double-strand break repair nuclease NurA [Leptolinea tardivitalis]GAP21617.1 protein containing NurA domain [Leptolinea tardivitalis]